MTDTCNPVDAVAALEAMQREIGGCREWCEDKADCCWAPAHYVLWGKLIPAEGLGPRCYDHAAKHVSASALAPGSQWALIDICGLVEAVRRAHEVTV
jgi:hypothetical protein